MIARFLPAIGLLAAVIASSCAHADRPIPPRILFPNDGAVIVEDIALPLESDRDGVLWYSSLTGVLGSGRAIVVKLTAGEHSIYASEGRTRSERIRVSVRARAFESGSSIVKTISQGITILTLPAGEILPCLASLGATTTARLRLSAESVSKSVSGAKAMDLNGEKTPIPRDKALSFHPHVESAKSFGRGSASPRAALSDAARYDTAIGEAFDFRMADLNAGTSSPGSVVHATLREMNDSIELWVESGLDLDPGAEAALWSKASNCVLPRVRLVWGSPREPSGSSNRVAILVSRKLNEGKIAVGFFNPADYYPRCDDAQRDDYNPTSNDRMIIYCGAPSELPGEESYCLDGIVATIAHELCHLISYSRTSYPEALAGNPSPFEEDLFLSEAMAHLTESLVGYGESGGDFAFAARYLSAPWKYSIASADLDGASDSVGKRGGALLYLSWLFRRNGGISFGPGGMEDRGGIAYLRSLLSTSTRGWRKIGGDTIFLEWIESIALNKNDGAIRDPETGQRIDIDPYAGDTTGPLGRQNLAGPSPLDLFGGEVQLPPRCAVWGAEILSGVNTRIAIEAFQADGTQRAVFCMK